MVRGQRAIIAPLWILVIATVILVAIALRAQPVTTIGHPVAQPAQISSMGDRTPAQTSVNPGSNQSVMTKVGTTQLGSAAKPATAPQQSQPSSGANNPCARAGKPSAMCPVSAP
jgi:hypothetical protein